jgi:lipid-A-disaccharide synthase
VGLVNLVAGSSVAPEFLQSRATPAALSDALLPLLDATSPASRQQRDGLALVRQRLGKPGAAGRVAELAEALLA